MLTALVFTYQQDDMIFLKNGLIEAILDKNGRVFAIFTNGSKRWASSFEIPSDCQRRIECRKKRTPTKHTVVRFVQ